MPTPFSTFCIWILILPLTILPALSQIPTFQRTYGGPGNESGASCTYHDGYFYLVGTDRSFTTSLGNHLILKTDSLGNLIWSKSIGTTFQRELFLHVTWDSTANELVVVGQTTQGSVALWDLNAVYRLNTNGTILSRRYLGANNRDEHNTASLFDGNDVILWGIEATNSTSYEVYGAKVDVNNNPVWMRRYSFSSGAERIHSCWQATEGNYVVGGVINSSVAILAGINEHGIPLWGKSYNFGDAVNAWVRGCSTLDGGSLMITRVLTNSGSRMLLMKTDSIGVPIWTRRYENQAALATKAIPQLDSTFLLAGYTSNGSGQGTDGLLMKIDQQGNILWQSAYGGSGYDVFNDLRVYADRLVAIGNSTTSLSSDDLWLVQTNLSGTLASGCQDVSLNLSPTTLNPTYTSITATTTPWSGTPSMTSLSTQNVTLQTAAQLPACEVILATDWQDWQAIPQIEGVELLGMIPNLFTEGEILIQHGSQGDQMKMLDRISFDEDEEEFSYQHLHPSPGKNYYQLLFEAADGSRAASNIKEVNWQSQGLVYPNPTNGLLYLKGMAEASRVSLFSAAGRHVFQQTILPGQSMNIGSFPAGMYLLKIHSPQGQFIEKILLTN